MNPYQSPEPDRPSDKFICQKCKQEAERTSLFGMAIGWIVIGLIVFLAAHGLMVILKQHGIVVSTVYGDEFWFENEIRKEIWRP